MESYTEELARSQLEKLYRLGLLERNSDDGDWKHSERSRINARHEEFLAALPPPSMFPMNMLQSSVNSDSSRAYSSRSGEFYSGSGSSLSSQLLLRKRSQRRTSLRSSGSTYSTQPKTQHRRALRMLFRQWKGFTRFKREKTRRREAVIVFLKQRMFTKWTAFLKRRRHEHELKRFLDSWRISRAISHWIQWRRRCFSLRNLLNKGRNSLVGRLIQQRIWRRWIQFTKRSKYIHGILSKRKDKLNRRLTRLMWMELRIHVFRAHQESLAVRRCLKTMRDFAGVQEKKRLQCAQYQQKVNFGRKRELLQRWRTFAYVSNRNRRLVGRVQFDIRRRRYFLLWFEVSRSVRHVERLRSRIRYRLLCKHFSAWKLRVKAVQLGDRKKIKDDKRIQAVYFRAFKDQLSFIILCSHVSLALRSRQLAKAVTFLHEWTLERRRRRNGISRVRYMWENRLVRRVWVTGWMSVRLRIQAAKHGSLILKARYFKTWKRFRNTRQTLHLQEADAESLHCEFCCKFIFRRWKAYHQLRMGHDQRLIKAEEHYHKHLLRKGVLILWDAVNENARNSLRGHQLRQNLRSSLKKRHFRAWHSFVQSKQRLSGLFHSLQASIKYRNSFCNPRRRAWDRWVLFLSKRQQHHHSTRHVQARVKLRALCIWRRQAKVEYRLRVFTIHKQRRTMEILVGYWKSHVNQLKKVAVICELAEKVYERKLFTRILREWLSRSKYLRHVRLCGESIHHQFVLKTLKTRFVEWQAEVEIRQCSSKLKHRRERQLLQKCFTSWHKHSSHHRKLARKLSHFQQVFGKYPASSLVFRAWSRWKRNCNQSRYVKALKRKHRLRQAKVCWTHWKTFHAACCTFRTWHEVARTLSTSNNRLGLRLREFRRSRRYRLKKSWMNKWKALVVRRRAVQEQQLQWKHQLNCELVESRRKLEQAALMQLRIWFRKVCIAHNGDNALARQHFSCRLLSKVIKLWWGATIHSKQEKVLVEAQKTMGKLSFYHPQQLIYAAQCDSLKKERKKVPKRRGRTKVVSIDANFRAESMVKMRRMLDPTEYASYSRFYQEGSREVVRTKPKPGKVKVLPGKSSVNRTDPVKQEYNHRDDTGNHDQDQRDHGDVEKETGLASICGNSNTFYGDNQANFQLQLALEERLYRQHHPGPPEASKISSTTCSTTPGNVLPLFDDEMDEIPTKCTRKQQNQTGYTLTTPRHVHFAPDPPAVQAASVVRNGSFVPSVNTYDSNRKGHRQSPRVLPTVNARSATSTTPRMFDVSSIQTSNGRSKPRVVKYRKAAQKKFIKVANSNCELRPLADILKLVDTNFPEYNEDHTVAQWKDSNNWDTAVVKEVVAFYVTLLLDQLGRSNGVNTTRLHVCFRMARDLALFRNDFYIDELQKVYDANFKDKSIDLAHSGLETLKYEEQLNLELFLEKLVDSYPSYRKCLDSKHPLDPLNWLAQCHLQPKVRLQAKSRGHTRHPTAFWIWEPMPADMDVALEKLLPAITKYMRVLGRFFLREAVRSSSTAGKPQDYRISSTAFISLMKQVRVFPQLFHRRELENAVRLSCQSSPDMEKLNFPEFIEALIRCSCNLRWGELGGGKPESNSDTVVVIKFVMLIFAMEGHGSMLKKRSEDVGAILGFLGQQQKKNQAEKLFRFRNMLADNKRQRRTSRSHQVPSVWNQIRLQFSPRSCPTRSPTKSHDTFDELTESWDGGSPRRVYTEPFVFDAQTNQPFDLDVSPSPNVEHSDQKTQPHSVQLVENSGSCGFNRESLPPTLVVDTVGDVTEPTEEAIQQVSAASLKCQPPSFSEENDSSELTSTARTIDGKETILTEQQLATQTHSTGLADPMEKDDFLREIMDNIGDVELLLSQARYSDTKQSRQLSRKTRPSDSIQYTNSVECVPSLSELAEDSHWQTTNVFTAASEVQVRDPILNYLTDSERFTENAGTPDYSNLVAIAGLPFTDDPPPQDFLSKPEVWASQEIRPTEEVVSNLVQASTPESNTAKAE